MGRTNRGKDKVAGIAGERSAGTENAEKSVRRRRAGVIIGLQMRFR
jgi:hypothetical protein